MAELFGNPEAFTVEGVNLLGILRGAKGAIHRTEDPSRMTRILEKAIEKLDAKWRASIGPAAVPVEKPKEDGR
jgi:hypothetical protein